MSTNGKPKSGAAIDALALLKADHEQVKSLFFEFDNLRENDDDDEPKFERVDEICYELTPHSMIEEDIFHPMLHSVIDDDELMGEAELGHAGMRELIGRFGTRYADGGHGDAMVAVSDEEASRHIEREERAIFDAVLDSGTDLDNLGERLAARKDELDEDLASPPQPTDPLEAHTKAHKAARHGPRPPD